jgi:hypothetical protein
MGLDQEKFKEVADQFYEKENEFLEEERLI